jgi:uncharacterized glyoxalase superfamily protein PhnB
MNQKEILPQGASWLTPYLTVTDADHSLDFYERAFGFGRGNTLAARDGQVVHAEMSYQGRTILMFSPEGAWSPMRTPAHSGCETPVSFYVYCADVDVLTERAREAGAIVLSTPEDMFWGDRMARLQDPDGYVWAFATRVGEFDPKKMPAMG